MFDTYDDYINWDKADPEQELDDLLDAADEANQRKLDEREDAE